MQCHYCDSEADVAIEKDHVKVGLCQEHLRDRMEELSESELLEDVQSELDDALE
jgi:organic radical activating enzyme